MDSYYSSLFFELCDNGLINHILIDNVLLRLLCLWFTALRFTMFTIYYVYTLLCLCFTMFMFLRDSRLYRYKQLDPNQKK